MPERVPTPPPPPGECQLAGGGGNVSPRTLLAKNCFVVATSCPFFVGIRGSVTIFSELGGNTIPTSRMS